MLRKCEFRRLPTRVATLHVAGSRVYVGDGQESVFFLRWVAGREAGAACMPSKLASAAACAWARHVPAHCFP
jgi:hypothetical protein